MTRASCCSRRATSTPAGTGADTVLTGFGTLLPESPTSIAGTGDLFLRFKTARGREALSGSTFFSNVTVDHVRVPWSRNQGF
jgi:hypothetical protein